MHATITPREIASGFVVAGATLCLGVYLSLLAGGDGGTAISRVFYLLAVLIVLRFTFAWGRRRGFPARKEDGSVDVSHVVRNLVMSAIVWCALIFLCAPIMMFAFQVAR